jgi:hypothetical protein
MDLIAILRVLWRRRPLVGAALVVSLGIGALMMFGRPSYKVGLAAQSVLIDTPQSAVADLNPTGGDVLQTRTLLLANLIGTAPVQASIAGEVGINPDLLKINSGSSGAPAISTLLATTLASKPPPSKMYELDVKTFDGIPIISFEATAPSAQRASALAGAAVHAIQHYLTLVGTNQKIPANRMLVVNPLGAPMSGTVVRGPSKAKAGIVAVAVFIALTTLIVIVTGLARGLREARQREEMAVAGGLPSAWGATDVADRSVDDDPATDLPESLALVRHELVPTAAADKRGRNAPARVPAPVAADAAAGEAHEQPAADGQEQPNDLAELVLGAAASLQKRSGKR